MSQDQQRAAFEALIKTHCDYDDLDRSEMMLAFEAYQAALASAEAQAWKKDAERYRFLAAYCRSTHEHWGGRWSIVVDGPCPASHDSEDDFDAAIDAAMEKQK